MQFKKFKRVGCLLSLAAISGAHAMERFSPRDCLEASFKTQLVQRGPLFGLLPHELIVNKNNCLINVKYRRYLPKEWSIDICREPVHIKVSSATGVDVAKKIEDCIKPDKTRNTSDFCGQYFALQDVMQDDGLIFAEGDRDSLSTPHGKIYCTYLLLDRYLGDGIVFSRYTELPDIFKKQEKLAPAQPAASSEAAPAVEAAPSL